MEIALINYIISVRGTKQQQWQVDNANKLWIEAVNTMTHDSFAICTCKLWKVTRQLFEYNSFPKVQNYLFSIENSILYLIITRGLQLVFCCTCTKVLLLFIVLTLASVNLWKYLYPVSKCKVLVFHKCQQIFFICHQV